MIENTTLLEHLDQIRTTKLGVERIKRNLSLDVDDVVDWCKKKMRCSSSHIYREGKNWYVEVDDLILTINAFSYTIITAHKK